MFIIPLLALVLSLFFAFVIFVALFVATVGAQRNARGTCKSMQLFVFSFFMIVVAVVHVLRVCVLVASWVTADMVGWLTSCLAV